MSLTRKEVEHVALLSRLALTDEQIEQMTHQLKAVLGYIEKLGELNTDDVAPLSHPMPIHSVFREDVRQPSLPREVALKNAPKQRMGFFEVPRIIT